MSLPLQVLSVALCRYNEYNHKKARQLEEIRKAQFQQVNSCNRWIYTLGTEK